MDINSLKIIKDNRGLLIPIEFNSLPFIPQRIFVVNNVPINTTRGGHSHYKTHQLIICLNGIVDVILHDGINEKIFTLNSNQQILVPKLIWDSQKFLSPNSEILVICSTTYDKDDYILDFDKFLSIKKSMLQ